MTLDNSIRMAPRERTWKELGTLLEEVCLTRSKLGRRLLGLMTEDSRELAQLVSLLNGLASEHASGALYDAFPPLEEDRWALAEALEKGKLDAALIAAERRRRQLRTALEMVEELRALAWVVDCVDVENWLAPRLLEWGGSIARRTGDLVPLVGAYIFSQRFADGGASETREAILGVVEEMLKLDGGRGG